MLNDEWEAYLVQAVRDGFRQAMKERGDLARPPPAPRSLDEMVHNEVRSALHEAITNNLRSALRETVNNRVTQLVGEALSTENLDVADQKEQVVVTAKKIRKNKNKPRPVIVPLRPQSLPLNKPMTPREHFRAKIMAKGGIDVSVGVDPNAPTIVVSFWCVCMLMFLGHSSRRTRK